MLDILSKSVLETSFITMFGRVLVQESYIRFNIWEVSTFCNPVSESGLILEANYIEKSISSIPKPHMVSESQLRKSEPAQHYVHCAHCFNGFTVWAWLIISSELVQNYLNNKPGYTTICSFKPFAD